jgi:Tfp pilus assembly protein PilF
MAKKAVVLVSGLLLFAAGCRQGSDCLTFRRGVQMLAAGSPKSAIAPFSQVIASVPDGPEPHAMLAVAYALDFQPEPAVKHAAIAQSKRKKAEKPGWESVALGIVAASQYKPDEAISQFEQITTTAPDGSPLKAPAIQWTVLVLLQKGDPKAAGDLLAGSFAADGGAAGRTTALLWSVLIHGSQGNAAEATKAIREAAAQLMGASRIRPIETAELASRSAQDLAEAGITAVQQGDLAKAQGIFAELNKRSPNAGDSLVWLALIDAAQGQWNSARDKLRSACQAGSTGSRGMANHLFSVVCALEGHPHDMIQHILVGQRLASRNQIPLPTPTEAKAEKVWFSDRAE